MNCSSYALLLDLSKFYLTPIFLMDSANLRGAYSLIHSYTVLYRLKGSVLIAVSLPTEYVESFNEALDDLRDVLSWRINPYNSFTFILDSKVTLEDWVNKSDTVDVNNSFNMSNSICFFVLIN